MNSEIDISSTSTSSNNDIVISTKNDSMVIQTETLADPTSVKLIELKETILSLKSMNEELSNKNDELSTKNISIEDMNLKYNVLKQRFESNLKSQEEKNKLIDNLLSETDCNQKLIDTLKEENDHLSQQLKSTRLQIDEFSDVLATTFPTTPKSNDKTEGVCSTTTISPFHSPKRTNSSSSVKNGTVTAYTYKYVIAGDTGVGKSCIFYQYTQKTFSQSHAATIGVEYGQRIIQVDSSHNAKLQIWDTSGQESFHVITRNYYKDAACCFLVYDITDRESFFHLTKWLVEARSNGNLNLYFLLIGNKLDLSENRIKERAVTPEEGQSFAKENGLLGFFETSAKSTEDIEKAFLYVTEKIYNDVKNGVLDINKENSGVKLSTLITPRIARNSINKLSDSHIDVKKTENPVDACMKSCCVIA